MSNAHNPDTNPRWKPLVALRIYECMGCSSRVEISTNHTGVVYAQRCYGKCRTITNPHTARERVSPWYGPHKYIGEAVS